MRNVVLHLPQLLKETVIFMLESILTFESIHDQDVQELLKKEII